MVFAAEWGDITQITTANLAARYADPLSVGVGAVLALWVLAGLAVTTGAKSLEVIPVVWVRRVTAVIMLGLAVWSAWAAAAGWAHVYRAAGKLAVATTVPSAALSRTLVMAAAWSGSGLPQ